MGAQHDLDKRLSEHVVSLEPIRIRLEMMERDRLTREQARQTFIDDVNELQRHSLANWTVMQHMLTELPGKRPYAFHVGNLKYLQDFKSFNALNIEMLPDLWRSMAYKIRAMLPNANNEIDDAHRYAKEGKTDDLADVLKLKLIPKAQTFFTIWTVADAPNYKGAEFYESLESNWIRDGLIEAARLDELKPTVNETTAWKLDTLKPGDGDLQFREIGYERP